MKNDLSCEVVSDLLPTYIDGLTSNTTNQAIESHLENCGHCREVYEQMKQPEEFAQQEMKQSIDYLKKVRKRTRQRIFIGVMIAVILILGCLFVKTFIVGKDLEDPDLVNAQFRVDGKTIVFQGELKDSSRGVSDIRFQNENGVIKIHLVETRGTLIHKNWFYTSYESGTKITQIQLEGRIIWDQGIDIDERTAKLYESRHLYVGDMPANGKSVSALNLQKYLENDFTVGLHTSKKPYGWSFFMEGSYTKQQQDMIEKRMKAAACGLIAVTDNLNYVTFEYKVDGKKHKISVNEKEADKLVGGSSIKSMARTPAGLQQLMETTGLLGI